MRRASTFAFAACVLTIAACVHPSIENDHACPCPAGSTCCTDTNVCVASGSPCPPAAAGDDAGPGVDGAMGGGGAGLGGGDGVWKGYFENYTLPSGSDTITMTLKISGQVVTGTMVFGDAPPPPAPTDPSAGYPANCPNDFAPYPMPFLGEGFVYTIVGGTFDGIRLQLAVDTFELWKLWCDLQTPFPNESNSGYLCLPDLGIALLQPSGCAQTTPMTQMQVPVDCCKARLCTTTVFCQCTASGCTHTSATDATFDMVVAPPRADGSIAGHAFDNHNVHFTHAH
jgi:hypothetical protein